MNAIRVLIFAFFYILHPGAEKIVDSRAVDALVKVWPEMSAQEKILLPTYIWYESQGQMEPVAYSWDAKAKVSCGLLQEPCEIAKKLSALGQLHYWLWCLRKAGLVNLDSDPKRAAKRYAIGTAAMQQALAQ